MLRSFLLWRITKGAYLTAFVLAFLLLSLQIFRIGFIILSLPLGSSFPFFLTWFAYYSFFSLPDGLILSTALTLSDLKERKLLNVLYSFHLSPGKILLFFLIPALLLFFLSLSLSFFLFEEHVSFIGRGLLLQYKDRILKNAPERVFLQTGDLVLYVRERKGEELRDIFLKHKDVQVLAKRARYEGNGRFLFEEGSILTKEKGKYFLVGFERYWLNTEEFFSAEVREKEVKKQKILNVVNAFSSIPLFLLSFFGVLRLCRTHLQVYYLVAFEIVLHQLLMFGLKIGISV